MGMRPFGFVVASLWLAVLAGCGAKEGWMCGSQTHIFYLRDAGVSYRDGEGCTEVCGALGVSASAASNEKVDCSFGDLDGGSPYVSCSVPDCEGM
jgi:hypothetical protein